MKNKAQFYIVLFVQSCEEKRKSSLRTNSANVSCPINADSLILHLFISCIRTVTVRSPAEEADKSEYSLKTVGFDASMSNVELTNQSSACSWIGMMRSPRSQVQDQLQ